MNLLRSILFNLAVLTFNSICYLLSSNWIHLVCAAVMVGALWINYLTFNIRRKYQHLKWYNESLENYQPSTVVNWRYEATTVPTRDKGDICAVRGEG